MGIVFRQSVKTTIVIGMGALLGVVFNFVGAYVLTKQEFGFLTNFIYIAAIFQIIVLMGTGALLSTYTQKYQATDIRRKALITYSAIFTLFANLIFTLVYFLLKDKIINLYKAGDMIYVECFYGWLPVLVFIWGFMTLAELYLLAYSKVAISTFMREVLLRLCNLIVIGLYFFKIISFQWLIIASVLVYIIPAGVIFFVASRTEGFGFTLNYKAFSKEEYAELFRFSWYHLLLSVTLNFLGYVDTLMLGPLDKNGFASLAAYRWAILIISIMTIPYRAMTNSSFATLNRTYLEKNHANLSDIFQRTGINILIVSLGMFLLIACNLDNLVKVLPEGYDVIKPIVLILMVGRLIDMATGLNTELISISRYYKFNFRISILLLLLIVILNRIYIPIYGIYGAAWGTTLSLILFNVIKMIYLWKKMEVQPFTTHSLTVVLAGITAGIAGYILPYLANPFLDTVIRSLLAILIYSFLLIKLKPSADLNTYFQSVVKNKKLY